MCNKIDDLKEAYKELVEIQKEAKLYADEIYIEQDEYIDFVMQKKAIERVRALHKVKDDGCCSHCSENTCWGCQEWADCLNCNCPCHGKYPCRTIKALDGEQG
jgi:hypothetical protein